MKVHLVHISDQVLYDGEARRVILPGVMGDLEIEEDHIPIVSLLWRGEIRIIRDTRHTATRHTASTMEETVKIEQGLARFDGEKLFAVVE